MNGYSIDESEIDEETAAFAVIKFGHLFKMYTRFLSGIKGPGELSLWGTLPNIHL